MGVPRDTERGDSDFLPAVGNRLGDEREPLGDALYRGGVIVSLGVLAIGVMSATRLERLLARDEGRGVGTSFI